MPRLCVCDADWNSLPLVSFESRQPSSSRAAPVWELPLPDTLRYPAIADEFGLQVTRTPIVSARLLFACFHPLPASPAVASVSRSRKRGRHHREQFLQACGDGAGRAGVLPGSVWFGVSPDRPPPPSRLPYCPKRPCPSGMPLGSMPYCCGVVSVCAVLCPARSMGLGSLSR